MTVHLITVGPGDRIEEMWGHNAVLVRDTAAGIEEAYNYGIFDATDPGFLADFYWGRGNYRVAELPLDVMLAGYRRAGRRVWAQELELEPAAKVRLLGLLRTEVLPENMFYRYNYYLNNCSTKVRDLLDIILGGQLKAATDGGRDGRSPALEGRVAANPRAAATWRHRTLRLAAEDPFAYLGIQLFMGPGGDESSTGWNDMWTPMKLRDTAGALLVTQSDGEPGSAGAIRRAVGRRRQGLPVHRSAPPGHAVPAFGPARRGSPVPARLRGPGARAGRTGRADRLRVRLGPLLPDHLRADRRPALDGAHLHLLESEHPAVQPAGPARRGKPDPHRAQGHHLGVGTAVHGVGPRPRADRAWFCTSSRRCRRGTGRCLPSCSR